MDIHQLMHHKEKQEKLVHDLKTVLELNSIYPKYELLSQRGRIEVLADYQRAQRELQSMKEVISRHKSKNLIWRGAKRKLS